MKKIFVRTQEDFDDAIKDIQYSKIVGLDTETSGLDPYTSKIWSIQIGTAKCGYLFPYTFLTAEQIQALQIVLKDTLLVAHNAKFDVKMLKVNGFATDSVWCTQEAERVLYAGKYFKFGLKDLLSRYFKKEVDKEIRDDFWNGTFEALILTDGIEAWTKDYIDYAITDIQYLIPIYEKQKEQGEKQGISTLLQNEASLVIALSNMELRGVWLDKKALKKFQSKVLLRRDELELEASQQLEKFYKARAQKEYARRLKIWDEWLIRHEKIKADTYEKDPDNARKKSDRAKQAVADSNKLKPYSSPPKLDDEFNLASALKLRMALSEALGIELTTTSKEWLEDNIALHIVIATLVEYRKFKKLAEFCEIDASINPVTGRIHCEFRQNGTVSGRQSCVNPNLQQIPARTDEAKEFRALFKAKEGMKFIDADFSGIELVIIAHDSNENILVDAINDGKDIHCFTMSKFLNCDYDILVALKKGEEISKDQLEDFQLARDKFEAQFYLSELVSKTKDMDWVKTFRDYVKTITYGLAYGLSAFGLSKKFHCEYIVAEQFIQRFFSVYPNIKRFLHNLEEKGISKLYAINPVGRRRYFSMPRPKSHADIEKDLIKYLEKNEKRLWDSVTDEEWSVLMSEAIEAAKKEYKGKINGVKRQAANFYPQSISAEMIKDATVEFDRQWREYRNGYSGLLLSVHDELLGEFFDEDVEVAAKMLSKVMEESGNKYLPNVKIVVEAKVSTVWEK